MTRHNSFSFTGQEVGLPDSFYIDSTTHQPSEQLLKSSIKVPNRQSVQVIVGLIKRNKKIGFVKKFLKRHNQKPKLLDCMTAPSIRKLIFIFDLLKWKSLFVERKKTDFSIGQGYSPELRVFYDTYPEIVNLSDAFEPTEEIKTKIADIAPERYEYVFEKPDTYKGLIYSICLSFSILEQVEKDLKAWNELEGEERRRLINVLFFAAIHFFPEFLNEQLSIYTGSEAFLSYMISQAPELMSDEINEAGTEVSDSPNSEIDALQSEQELVNWVEQWLSRSNELATVEEAESLGVVANKLAKIREENSKRAELYQIGLEKWINSIYRLGVKLNTPHYTSDSEEEITPLIASLWINYITDTKNPIEEYLVDIITELNRQIEGEAAESLTWLRSRYQQVESQIAELEDQIFTSVIEQRKAKRETNDLKSEKLIIENKITQKEDELAAVCLPPELSLEDLETADSKPNYDIILTNPLWHKPIQFFGDWLKSDEHDQIFNSTSDEITCLDFDGQNDIEEQGNELPESDSVEAQIEEPDGDDEVTELEPTPKLQEGVISEEEHLDNHFEDDWQTEETAIDTTEEEIFETPEYQPEEPEQEKDTEAEVSVEVETTELEPALKDTPPKSELPETASQEGQACLEAWSSEVFIPGPLANSAISKMVMCDQMELASQFAYIMKEERLSEDFVGLSLLRASYYGGYVFDDRLVFNKAAKELNSLTLEDYREYAEQPGAAMVPYLLFIAILQPAIFGGNSSNAPLLLRELDGLFDSHTNNLIQNTLELTNHGQKVTLADLRNAGCAKEEQSEFDKASLFEWEQKIREARRGYAPVLKALKAQLEHGLFKEISDVIKQDNRENQATVVDFVSRYADQEKSNHLLEQTLQENNLPVGNGIPKMGKLRFYHRVEELIEISKDWIEAQPHVYQSSVEDYCKRFMTLLQQSISYFSQIASDNSQNGKQPGATLVVRRLQFLLDTVTLQQKPWSYQHVKGWYYHPEKIMHQSVGTSADKSPELITWLFCNIGKDIRTVENMELAFENDQIQLARLLHLHFEENNINAPDIDFDARFDNYIKNLYERFTYLDGQLENALLSNLLEAEEVERFHGDLNDMRDSVEQANSLSDMSAIDYRITEIENQIHKHTNNTKAKLQAKYKEGLRKITVIFRDDPIDPEWQKEMEQAIEESNFPVANEMLDELTTAIKKKQRITRLVIKDVGVFQDFMDKQQFIHDAITDAIKLNNKRGVEHLVTNNNKSLGLDFNHLQSKGKDTIKKAIQALRNLKHKPKARIESVTYDQVVSMLEVIGITPEASCFSDIPTARLGYRAGSSGFSSMSLPIKDSGSTHPFTRFGSRATTAPLPIVIAHMEWTPDTLFEVLDSHSVSDEALLISSVPMNRSLRNNFALQCKNRLKTIYHVDYSVLLYLGALNISGADKLRIRNFLWLTAPFTYFNPYNALNIAKPPFPEMCYGRESEINSLQKMENGAAIVFGGRQLGKSTILENVRRRRHNPRQYQYAFYEMLDKDSTHRMSVSEKDHEKARLTIWKAMYQKLKEANLIKEYVSGNNPEQFVASVKRTLKESEGEFIFIFDEIDPILNIDAHMNFGIFRELRNIVQDNSLQGRFKIIIGGLQNVKRFENSPNYPLTQLGGSIQVSIMPTKEALHLIKEPLKAAGYGFANSHVANRILAITNRHPGVIQAFCHELIKNLASNANNKVSQYQINDTDISRISELTEVTDLIRERFNWTLNLDGRYKVIIYGLIDSGVGVQPFTAQEAWEIAVVWLPQAFASQSVRQFEAFLVEMVGLGVLRQADGGRYALRNTNVLKLLADVQGDDIAKQLDSAINSYTNYDPLDRHAYDREKDLLPSPLSYRDEMTLIGTNRHAETQQIREGVKTTSITTTIIVGSDAQGVEQILDTLPPLYQDEQESYPRISEKSYKVLRFKSEKYQTPLNFKSVVLDSSIIKTARKRPVMAFIDVNSETPVPLLLGMLDVAYQFESSNESLKYPVRIIFLMKPASYWNWLSQQSRYASEAHAVVKLGLWQEGAIAALLDKLGMNHSNHEAMQSVMQITRQWYWSIKRIVELKRKNPKWLEVRKMPLSDTASLSEKEAKEFGQVCGLYDVDWAKDYLNLLVQYEFEHADEDVLKLLAEEMSETYGESPERNFSAMLQWLLDMNFLLLNRVKEGDSEHNSHYEISPVVRQFLNAQSA